MRQLIGAKGVSRRHKQVDLQAGFEVDQVKWPSSPDSLNDCALVDIKVRGKRILKVVDLLGAQIDYDIDILSGARNTM